MKQITGISGSLRKGSFNTALLQTADAFFPKESPLRIISLEEIPLYNDDLARGAVPESVIEFRKIIENSAGVLIATPEYNYSMSGVLKNALDWATTNELSNVFDGKATAIMGASKTIFGTVRSQLHLRQVLMAAKAIVVQHPEVHVRKAHTIIDEKGILTDGYTQEKIQQLVGSLLEMISHSQN
jgi:chromate reductase, NAD(P)H dehydrogenase (quinone)